MSFDISKNYKERIIFEKWAYYDCEYERAGVFMTVTNDVILLFSKNVTVHNAIPTYYFKVVHIKEKTTHIFEVELPIFVEFIDCFSTGEYLFTKSRNFFVEGPTCYITHPTGTIIKNIQLGDGVEHLQIDAQDRIWVGYSQAGVEGQLGWSKATTIGRDAVVVFSKQGDKVWSAAQLQMKHCNAFNIGLADRQYFVKNDGEIVRFTMETGKTQYVLQKAIHQHFLISDDESIIALSEANQLIHYRSVQQRHQPFTEIELINEQAKPIKGQLLIRNKTMLCINGPVIYRANYV